VRKENTGHRDFGDFILMVLLKDEPLRYDDLEQRFLTLASHFQLTAKMVLSSFFRGNFNFAFEDGKKRRRLIAGREVDFEKHHNIREECASLEKKGLIDRDDEGSYRLTAEGKIKAEQAANGMERAAGTFRRNFLNPTAAARNTFVADLFLASMKLLVGLISGSVGLIADGADAGIDTVSAVVVWLGVRLKKELIATIIILIMMGFTGVSIGYESVGSIMHTISGTIKPVALPLLVIAVEIVALLFAVIMTFYQRAVGKRYGSFALISQSIDSNNHIYVALAVISGALCSMLGIHFIDALIGVYVSFKILRDAVGLLGEVISSVQGRESDLSKYKMPFEERWHLTKRETLRMWILYALKECRLTKKDIVDFLEKTFKPTYMPILSEFRFGLGMDLDYDVEFDDLVKPMLREKWVAKDGDFFVLTKDGTRKVDSVFRIMRFHQYE
jgi:hypothetical protein